MSTAINHRPFSQTPSTTKQITRPVAKKTQTKGFFDAININNAKNLLAAVTFAVLPTQADGFSYGPTSSPTLQPIPPTPSPNVAVDFTLMDGVYIGAGLFGAAVLSYCVQRICSSRTNISAEQSEESDLQGDGVDQTNVYIPPEAPQQVNQPTSQNGNSDFHKGYNPGTASSFPSTFPSMAQPSVTEMFSFSNSIKGSLGSILAGSLTQIVDNDDEVFPSVARQVASSSSPVNED